MTKRKRKLRILQLFLLFLGLTIIFFTYANKEKKTEIVIPKSQQEKINSQLTDKKLENTDIFYNIEYSGLDLAGNRYTLKSEEAYNNKSNNELINMKFVEAIFYFKDDTILYVKSNEGLYNNKTLDMNFYGNVTAKYQESELFAEKAEYSNLRSFLTISENVEIKDVKGSVFAEKLLFDIKKQKLNIASFNGGKVSANLSLK
jgi:Uncharacterized protein conserved in bacteria|tara:strand:+ start:192 stop:797 length:606 start_codon:yes stop_codon:yes gene_type:complete